VEKAKINLGCGGHKHQEYVNVDINRKQSPDIVADVSDLWMVGDAKFDEVLASHVFEHFLPEEQSNVLEEWKRIMKPGGTIQIRVPNLPYICHSYLNGDVTVDHFCNGGDADETRTEPDLHDLCLLYLHGAIDANEFSEECFKHKPECSIHHVIFDDKTLANLLEANGFVDVKAADGNTPVFPDVVTPGRILPDTLVVHARKSFSISKMIHPIKLGIVMPRLEEMPTDKYCSISKLVIAQLPYFVEAGIEPYVFSVRKTGEDHTFSEGVHYYRHTGTLEEYLAWIGTLSDSLDLDLLEMFNRAWNIETKAKQLIHMSNDHLRIEHLPVMEKVACITLISKYLQTQVSERFSQTECRYSLNRLGVDTRLFHPMTKADPPVLLWVGLLDNPKGLVHFVEVANLLLEKHPALQVKIAGPLSLPTLSDSHTLVSEYVQICMDKADDRITWLGEVESSELPELFATASIMMAPMQQAFTWSLAIMEAQASGTAVVASDLGGLSECFVNGESGCVVPFGAPVQFQAELFHACNALLSTPGLVEKFGECARKFALNYDWKKTAQRGTELYVDTYWS